MDKQVVASVFVLRFIDDVCVDATARPGSHVGSRCHDVRINSLGTSYLHIPR